MGLRTTGQSAQPTASAKRRGLPGPGFAAHHAARTADIEVQLCAESSSMHSSRSEHNLGRAAPNAPTMRE